MQKSAHPPANQGRGALQQGHEIGGGLFIAHQELAESVEPRMRAFDHPAARPLPSAAGAGLLPPLTHVRCIAPLPHGMRGGLARIALVRAQILPPPPGDFGADDHDAVQGGLQQFDIMPVGPADDKGERDASTVHQQAALGSFSIPAKI